MATPNRFHGGSVAFTGGGNELTMAMKASVIGHTYQVQFTSDLAIGEWENVGDAQAGTGYDLAFSLPYFPGTSRGFYRILIQR